jgi:hypothetical protein
MPSGVAGAMGVPFGANGTAGTMPGGGGGGAANYSTTGGAGGSGMVNITYTPSTLSVNTLPTELIQLNIAPNPSSGQFLISSKSKIEHLFILNLNGEIVFEIKNVNASSILINIPENEKGIFILKAVCEGNEITKKIVRL